MPQRVPLSISSESSSSPSVEGGPTQPGAEARGQGAQVEPNPRPGLISVVVPLYNEQETVEPLYRRLTDTLGSMGHDYELLLVDDGSTDGTLTRIEALQDHDARIGLVRLSRNFGHQAAVSAGIDHARGDAVVVMDGDLQDPPEVLPSFVRLWRDDGYEVVYAVRRHRKEGPLKRAGYFLFYRLLRAISDLDIPLDSGDFCLMDRQVVDALQALPERMRFVRLRTFVGFRQIGLEYDRAARVAGKPKYSFRALCSLAVDGLISFSSYPLHLVTYLGLFTAAVAFGLCLWVFADALASGQSPRGWASLIVVVLFLGSVQMISLGIIGEYIRRIFLESKGRPTYLVREFRTRTGAAPTAASGSWTNRAHDPSHPEAEAEPRGDR